MLLKDLIPFLRFSLNDRDSADYEYSDIELEKYLQFGIQEVESEWTQEYEVIEGVEGLEVSPEPPVWTQMLFVLKTAIMARSFQDNYHFKTSAFSVTNSSLKDTIEKLEDTYKSIEKEHRYSDAAYIFTTWDDYKQRVDSIYDTLFYLRRGEIK